MHARAPRARRTLLLVSSCALAWPASAGAREVGLRWVAAGTSAPAGYVAYVRTPDRPYEDGLDLGLPGVDADGLYSVRLYDVPDGDVFLALRAYSEEGAESKLSNEVRIPAAPPATPAWNDVTVAVDDGALHPLFDASEGGVAELSGVRVAYGAAMDGRGRLRGAGGADLDGDGVYETGVRVKGRVRGKDGTIASKLRLRASGRSEDGKVRLRALLRRDIQADAGSADDAVRTRGKVFGDRVADDVAERSSVDTRSLGWTLTFRIDPSEGGGRKDAVGTLRMADGRSVALSGKARARGSEGLWKVRLRSSGADKGIRIRMDDLDVDSAFQVRSGRLRFDAFGQSGELELPSGL